MRIRATRIEQLVAEGNREVQDEFDTRERGVRPEVEWLSDSTCSVDGLMALASFVNQFGIQPHPSSAQTLGGYVFERLDRLPQMGDSIVLGDYQLRVEELDHRRIARLRVERKEEANEVVSSISKITYALRPPVMATWHVRSSKRGKI